LPDFNSFLEVWVDGEDEKVQVYGGSVLPDNLIGFFICIEGELCYIGDAPAQVIPDEVWCQETEPTDPAVEIWTFNGITKTKNPDGQWVQTTPFGA